MTDQEATELVEMAARPYPTNETGCVVSLSRITGDIVCQIPGPDCDCLIVAVQREDDA